MSAVKAWGGRWDWGGGGQWEKERTSVIFLILKINLKNQ